MKERRLLRSIGVVIRKLAIWYSVALASLFVMFLIAQISCPPQLNQTIKRGVEEVEEVARAISSSRHLYEVKIMQNGTIEVGYNHPSYAEELLKVSLLIFSRNARIVTVLIIPLIGLGFYTSMIVVNAWVGRAIAEMVGGSQWCQVLFSTLFLKPHSHLEFLAYSIAVYESTLLGISLRKVSSKTEILKRCLLYGVTSLATLFIAALVEAYTILG